jgi:hypothetical protein
VSSEQLNLSALRVAVGKRGFQEIFGALKFECCLLSSRALFADCRCLRRVVSFASVVELILRCKTTEGVVKERIKHDAELVHVRGKFARRSAHTSSSADVHGTDGVAVRVVLHEELEGTLPLLQQALLAAERNCAPVDARAAHCAIVEGIGS